MNRSVEVCSVSLVISIAYYSTIVVWSDLPRALDWIGLVIVGSDNF
jgi:hypothetical protein